MDIFWFERDNRCIRCFSFAPLNFFCKFYINSTFCFIYYLFFKFFFYLKSCPECFWLLWTDCHSAALNINSAQVRFARCQIIVMVSLPALVVHVLDHAPFCHSLTFPLSAALSVSSLLLAQFIACCFVFGSFTFCRQQRKYDLWRKWPSLRLWGFWVLLSCWQALKWTTRQHRQFLLVIHSFSMWSVESKHTTTSKQTVLALHHSFRFPAKL